MEKYKFKTKLHALIAKGPIPSRRAWQDTILIYLTQNCSVTDKFDKDKKSFFVSPLPVNVVPGKSLVDELRTEENGFIPLVLALHLNCPSDVIAALCHLFPEGATVPFKDGSIALHIAARHPTGNTKSGKPDPNVSDNLKSIGILAEAYPMGVISRDNMGRTPLHILLEHHASSRHVELIERLSRTVDEKVWRYEVEAQSEEGDEKVELPLPGVLRKKLNKEEQDHYPNVFVPASALAIPDKIYGALPIHYAVKNGAPKEVIQALIKGYPASIVSTDCFKRNPLHWCFGAGGDATIIGYSNETIPMHHVHRSSNIISVLLNEGTIGGLDVASMRDRHLSGKLHRTALHYAIELLAKNILDPAPLKGEDDKGPASCLTIKSLQTIINANRSALVTRDALGQTPLHVLFRTVFEKHSLEYTKALHIAQTGAANVSQPKDPFIFSPPLVLMDLLLQNVDRYGLEEEEGFIASCASDVTDARGLLPIHCAVLVASSPKVVKTLVESNPRSLTQLSKGSVSDDAVFIRDYYDFLIPDDDFFVSSFQSSRTPLHMAFANPFISRAHSKEMIQNLLYFESIVDEDEERRETASDDEDESQQIVPKKRVLKIDGSISLKMQDASGDTPLHLAAKNNASLEMLELLLQYDSEAATFMNNAGNLPLHLLLDRNFLFVHAELAEAHGSKDNKQDALDSTTLTSEFRQKVRDLAKKQTVVVRLQKFSLCGAIFAPNNGWTSEDDDDTMQTSYITMKKINLLGMAAIEEAKSLFCSDSTYGLNCLQIFVAFHAAPYSVLHNILKRCPETALHKSTNNGYTALDIHCVRRNIPNEVRKQEIDAWKAIKELLFSYEVFPIHSVADKIHGALNISRKDKEFISSLEQQIVAEIMGEFSLSYHWNKNHPVDPIHVKLGFTEVEPTTCPDEINMNAVLSDTCGRVWVFFTIFVNVNDECDQYSSTVERIIDVLSHEEIGYLSGMTIPSDALNGADSPMVDKDQFTVQNYANIYCKKVIFQKYSCFAGMYDFAPKSTSSILLHQSRNNDSIMIHAHQLEFSLKKQKGEGAKSPWMFDPNSGFKKRSDYEIKEIQVVFKFMTKRLDFDREVKWRKELNLVDSSSHLLQVISTFEPNHIDGEVDKKYAVDRMHKRFKDLPLRKDAADRMEFIDITKYPFALVFPYAGSGSLQDMMNRDNLTLAEIQRAASQMGNALNEIHDHGLVHGSFSASNVLSFLYHKDGILERNFKLGGLSSVTPSGLVGDRIKLGAITPGGRCLFDSSTLPPEMFMKLDRLQLEQYNVYWKVVMKLKNVEISEELIKPLIDPITHEVYVKKCYCHLDEATMQALPHLPYDLVDFDKSLDVWAFGILLFQMLSGGESIFTSKVYSAEILAKWDVHVAYSIVSQNIANVAAQDLLVHILSPIHIRQCIDMKVVLAHPFFSANPLPNEINQLLTNAKEERELIVKIRGKQFESDKMTEAELEPTRLGRLGLRTQLRLTNSATEALRECFDPHTKFMKNAPFTFILLPYQLKRKGEGKYSLATDIDVELAQRLGSQILELCKVLWFAVCYSEKLKSGGDDFRQILSNFFTTSYEVGPAEFGKNILRVLRLGDYEYGEVATNFVLVVQELVQMHEQAFIDDPLTPVLTLISQCASKIANTFSITNQGYLYLVDEYSCSIAHGTDKISHFPHLFRDNVHDVLYKCLPYIHASVSSVVCAEHGSRGLLKLLCGESDSVAMFKSWEDSFSGIPTVPIRKRMVQELALLHEALHSTLIPSDSPMALNGEGELHFFSSLFVHIDSSRTFAGLRPITDETGTMWVTEKSKLMLLQESALESKPESVYDAFAREELRNEEVTEKDKKIAHLEKALRKARLEAEKARAEMEI